MFPSLLTRYVIWELTRIFLVSSAGFVGLMVLIGLATEALDHGLGPDVIFQLLPYIIPKALMFAMPATCLFSACVVFGRMAADNELIAVESLGLQKSVLIVPALILAFLTSLVAVWVNDVSFAWSYWGVEQVVLSSTDKIVYGVLQTEGSFSTERFSIEVDGIEGRRLIHPIITINNSNGKNTRIVAEEAVLISNPKHHSLSVTVTNGMIDMDGKTVLRFDDSISHDIPLKTPDEIAKKVGNPAHLYLSQIVRSIETQQDDLEALEKENVLRACGDLMGGDVLGLTHASWNLRNEEETLATERLNRLHVVPHRRWASGFSCLAFVVIGIPVAMRLKTANYATTFGICFLPILFIYYPLFMFGLDNAKRGVFPPYAAWFGDVACMTIGGILLFRELRK